MEAAISSTTIPLAGELEACVAAAASRSGTTTHSFIIFVQANEKHLNAYTIRCLLTALNGCARSDSNAPPLGSQFEK
jgi:hypothetical protein